MPLTVGVVGAGSMGCEHARQLRALGVRTLMWSRSGADAAAAALGVESVSSFEALLTGADVIDVTTPTPTHLDLGRAVLAAGKHLICEKPLARTVDDALALVAAAEASGRLLLPAHVARWFPAYARVKTEVDGGELGSLQRLRFYRGGAYPTSPWFADRAQSGGVVMDLMIHDLDQARWLVGEAVRVEATRDEGVVAGHPFESASVTLTHASGVLTRVDGVWGPPDTTFTTEFAVVGSAGSREHSSRDEERGAADGQSPYLAQLRDFLAAIETGAPVRVAPADAVAAVRLATAALESIETGRSVELG
ncbi:Gfo/Idh/MocA family oxidoreductase [Gryllotalpicola daejeonensis]|uniref:Gfo/Idh/MocA family oxidoreductase n=1 Tax=Gryllotalpicola daejeonensis TaxID=993087 RepID=A0ABP7ZJ97_9MICO